MLISLLYIIIRFSLYISLQNKKSLFLPGVPIREKSLRQSIRTGRLNILNGTYNRWLWTAISVLLLGLAWTGVSSWLAPPSKQPVYQVGILISGQSRLDKVKGLQEGLRSLGFVEGQNIVYSIHSADEDPQRLAALAKQLIAGPFSLLIAPGTLEALTLIQAAGEIPPPGLGHPPIIFAGGAATNASLIRNCDPASPITGVDNQDPELSGKRLEHFKRLYPNLRRVGLVLDPGLFPSEQGAAIARRAAKSLGLEWFDIPIASVADIAQIPRQYRLKAGDGLLLLPGFTVESGLTVFHRLTVREKVPLMGVRVKGAEEHYLFSFGAATFQQGIQTSRLAAKILSGQNPADIPAESPDRVELVVNVRIAERMGLYIPPERLRFADVLAERDADD